MIILLHLNFSFTIQGSLHDNEGISALGAGISFYVANNEFITYMTVVLCS
jgi:hypothetical protein